MDISNYSVIFYGLIPSVACLILLVCLLMKLFKGNNNFVSKNSLWTNIALSFLLFLVYLIYTIGFFCGNFKAYGSAGVEYLVSFVYLISAFFSLAQCFYYGFIYKMHRSVYPFYIVSGISLLIIALLVFYILIKKNTLMLTIVVRAMMFINLLFLVVRYLYNTYKKGSYSRQEILYIGMMSVYNFIYLFYKIDTYSCFDSILAVSANIAVLVLGCNYIFRSEQHNKRDRNHAETDTPLTRTEVSDSYVNKNGYKIEERDLLANRFILYLIQNKPYLDNTLVIDNIVRILHTNKTYLSRIINEDFKKNFRELVNSYKVKEAIRLFARNVDLSVPELMKMSGFNNNSSFTNAFKTFTGYTPGAWCRRMKKKIMKKEG